MGNSVRNSLPRWPFVVDPDKVVEALLFVIPLIRRPSIHSLSKVLYHADKAHLSRYGRPIIGDRYIAMKHGPVPSYTYDILKTLRGDSNFPLPERAEGALAVDMMSVVSALRRADTSVLSRSELECLKVSAGENGTKTFGQQTEDSHGPAWQAADENDVIALENLLLEIANRDELLEHFLQVDP
jgi:uncharacterized phage-associated protein